MIARKILTTLADGHFHSGQALANALGVSRTAIWKQLSKLEHLGVRVESIRGRGYRIPGGLDLIDEAGVRAALSQDAVQRLDALLLLETTESTNVEVLRRAGDGLRCVAISADRQTGGRGRRGRSWQSPFAGGLALSLGWRFEGGAAGLEGLSLAVGVLVAESLESLGAPPIGLKWPNDLLVDGRKLGGILVELSGDAAGPCWVAIGIGVNVALGSGAPIDQPWVDLGRLAGRADSGHRIGRGALLAALLNHVVPALSRFEREGFSPWRAGFASRDAFADRPVTVQRGDRYVAGTARGVSISGALLLETVTGVQTIHGGEVSLRARSS